MIMQLFIHASWPAVLLPPHRCGCSPCLPALSQGCVLAPCPHGADRPSPCRRQVPLAHAAASLGSQSLQESPGQPERAAGFPADPAPHAPPSHHIHRGPAAGPGNAFPPEPVPGRHHQGAPGEPHPPEGGEGGGEVLQPCEVAGGTLCLLRAVTPGEHRRRGCTVCVGSCRGFSVKPFSGI